MANYDQRPEINLRKYLPLAALILFFILLIAFWGRMFVTVPAGYGGIIFRTFSGGLDLNRTFNEGFHLVAPWNRMHIYEVRQQEKEETMNVLSSDGLQIIVEVSVWFRPLYDQLARLHGKIGEDYINRIVIPSIRSAARDVIGKYNPEEIYSTKRGAIQTEIEHGARELMAEWHVQLNSVLIRSIFLPEKIKTAIEDKKEQEQIALAYEFRLQTAEKEAERRRIDAEGTARANNIINASLTANILRDKGINATLELAKSPNAKVVVIGSGAEGMPIILGGQ